MTELDEHACRVGRIAMAAAQLEAEVAHVVYVGTTGAWDNSDDWLPLAENTPKLRRAFARIAKVYPDLLDGEVLVPQLKDLLDRRNKIVHSSVRYSFFEYENGTLRVRENPHEPQAIHAQTGRPEPLPTSDDIDALEGELQELARVVRVASGRVAAAFANRADEGD